MTHPFSPEPIEYLRARLSSALEDVYLYPNSGPTRPGTQRRHVFDTEQGIRLIISRGTLRASADEEISSAETFLHVSASSRGRLLIWKVLKLTKALFRRDMNGDVLGESPGGVLHLKFPDVTPAITADREA